MSIPHLEIKDPRQHSIKTQIKEVQKRKRLCAFVVPLLGDKREAFVYWTDDITQGHTETQFTPKKVNRETVCWSKWSEGKKSWLVHTNASSDWIYFGGTFWLLVHRQTSSVGRIDRERV